MVIICRKQRTCESIKNKTTSLNFVVDFNRQKVYLQL